MSASNPSKRPRSSENEDDRHDRSEEEENEGGMTSALASAFEALFDLLVLLISFF